MKTEAFASLAFIGGGNMASALIGGLLKYGVSPTHLYVIDPQAQIRRRLASTFGILTDAALNATLSAYDVLILAVKPQIIKEVAHGLAPHLNTQLVISIAAGVRAVDISRWLGGYARIVRAMPNTPALIGQGITGVTALNGVDAAGRSLAQQVLAATGEVVWCDNESQIDAVTAISGSGPAYVFYFIEAVEEAARQLGLNPAQSRALTLATFAGAAQLAAHVDEPVHLLRERVTSKGGTTAAAFTSFTHDQVKEAIVRGALAAHKRAQQMAHSDSGT